MRYETDKEALREAGLSSAEERVTTGGLHGGACSPKITGHSAEMRGQARGLDPSPKKEIKVSVTRVVSSLGQSSTVRRALEEGQQRSYDQMVFAGMTMSRATGWSQLVGRDQAHWGAQAEFQRLVNKYHRLLYRELDPEEGFEVRIPKRAVLPSPELMDPEVRLKQGRIRAAEVVRGWSPPGRWRAETVGFSRPRWRRRWTPRPGPNTSGSSRTRGWLRIVGASKPQTTPITTYNACRHRSLAPRGPGVGQGKEEEPRKGL
jgi:hypothetical protein